MDNPPFITGTFDHLDWTYSQFHEDCSNCHKPLAFHYLTHDNKAAVSCPRCDAKAGKSGIPNIKLMEIILDKPASPSTSGGRPPLPIPAKQKTARRKAQIREARRRHYARSKGDGSSCNQKPI